jgi:hypothetical protein
MVAKDNESTLAFIAGHKRNGRPALPLNCSEWGFSSIQGAADSEAHYGLIDYDGAGKLAIAAVRNILPLIRDDVIERRLPVTDPRDYVFHLRHPDGEHALLFWSTRNASEADAFLRVGRDKGMRMTSAPQLIETGEDVPQVAVTNGEGP